MAWDASWWTNNKTISTWVGHQYAGIHSAMERRKILSHYVFSCGRYPFFVVFLPIVGMIHWNGPFTLINNQFNGKGNSEPNMTQRLVASVISVRLNINIQKKHTGDVMFDFSTMIGSSNVTNISFMVESVLCE